MRTALVGIFLYLFVASTANSESGRNMWQTVIVDRDNRISHDIDLASVMRDPDDRNVYSFTHRMRLHKPVTVIPFPNATAIVTLNALNCKTRKTAIISDSLLEDSNVLASNMLTQVDTPSVPAEGTPHAWVLREICSKQSLLLGTSI